MNTVFSYIITFASGLIIGIFGNYYAKRLSDKAKHKDSLKARKKEFKEIKFKMPELIDEMREDLENPSMKSCREFFISPSKSIVFNSRCPVFMYYENEHDNIMSKIRILENAGFIYDVTKGNTPKYQFVEEFVKLLLNEV